MSNEILSKNDLETIINLKKVLGDNIILWPIRLKNELLMKLILYIEKELEKELKNAK